MAETRWARIRETRDRGSVHEGGLPERGDIVGTCDTARVVRLLPSYLPRTIIPKIKIKSSDTDQLVGK